MSAITCPAPGIYPGVPADQYHAWDAASNSRLSLLAHSPAHLQAALLAPKAPTDAQVLGTAAHTLTLEPERFHASYVMVDQCTASTGKGERCANAGKVRIGEAWFCGTHLKGKEGDVDARAPLLPDVWDRVHRMAEAVHAHPAAAALLGLAGDTEVSVVWTDPATGVVCKSRPDRLCGSEELQLDVKTTEDASREAFTRSIFKFGYHRQGAHYIDGMAAHGVTIRHHALVAVEKTPPYGVAVYRIQDDAIEAGRTELRALLSTYAWCTERGEWPCYTTEITDISLPAWAWGQIERDGL